MTLSRAPGVYVITAIWGEIKILASSNERLSSPDIHLN